MHKATFDEYGNRTASYRTDIHSNIPTDAIEITDEEQSLYVTNEYIRSADGKPIKKPVHVPTVEEIRQEKMARINQTYSMKLENILKAIEMASARKDLSVVTKLQITYVATQEEWKVKLKEVI